MFAFQAFFAGVACGSEMPAREILITACFVLFPAVGALGGRLPSLPW